MPYADDRISEITRFLDNTNAAIAEANLPRDRAAHVYTAMAPLISERASLRLAAIERQEALDRAHVTHTGVRHYGDDATSGVRWYVVQRPAPEHVLHYLESIGVPLAPTRCHTGDYDCCGRQFISFVRIRRSPTRLLIKVHYGTDV